MPTVTEAIRSFLTARRATHNGPDLIDLYLEHASHLETQVNVAAGNGWPVDGKRGSFTDGIDEWFNLRIPSNASDKPHFRDYEIRYPFDLHAEAIGSTGWDWNNRTSRFFGYDFDSITGHAAGVGVTVDELDRIREAAQAIPWVSVRRSTGGKGLHLYVVLSEGIETENHAVHAALSRSILGVMSSEAGFDFASQIDACGGIMWLWARRMTAENGGLSLIKKGEKLAESAVPPNWRDHLDVVTRQRSKIRMGGITESSQSAFDALASSRRVAPLDDSHKAVIDALRQTGFSSIWVPDYNLLQTHTCALDTLMKEQKSNLKLIGFFATNSTGKDPGQPNCFLFPLDHGAWRVYRFGQGISESETWEQDGQGWTTCYFNHAPNLRVASRASGGVEDASKGGFVFETATRALAAAEALGQTIMLPDELLARETRLRVHKDGRLMAQIDRKDDDEGMKSRGWLAKKTFWEQVFQTKVESKAASTDVDLVEHDDLVRAISAPTGDRAGWMVCQKSGDWRRVPKDDAKSLLLSRKFSKSETDIILGMAVEEDWKLVNMPFQPEFPGNRQWNCGAAQYKYIPANLKDDGPPCHPHWDTVLKHCGQDLDSALKGLEWAKAAGVNTGADYLLHWAACMLREPYEKLPYLFFWGGQNSGKSTYHEAMALLMTKGVASADRALTNANDFNGELANAVLAFIEEKDISLSPGAYNKLKDWVTSPLIWVRKMRTDAYSQVNTLHFVQTANTRESCTIKSGDTRITMFFVPDLLVGQEIPKPILMDRLRDEAPHFMRTIIDLQLPPVYGRLRLPVVNTDSKTRAEESTRSPLEAFLADKCFEAPGELIPFSEFFDRFQKWMDEEEIDDRTQWCAKTKVARQLPHKFPYGVKHSNQRFVGNISFEQKLISIDTPPLVVVGGKLRLKGS